MATTSIHTNELYWAATNRSFGPTVSFTCSPAYPKSFVEDSEYEPPHDCDVIQRMSEAWRGIDQ